MWEEKTLYAVFFNRHHRRCGFRTVLERDYFMKEGIEQETENRKVSKYRVYKEHLRQYVQEKGYDAKVTRALYLNQEAT
ncbi:MAG: hypothetical protein A2W71_01820 [Candidatus Nealsonbacteria bacterium RIFCSPLOWO2_02_39_8]|uniref:Uncharacterized protein n=3 Tax=Parcubacteria group TaxID=1794811 RepID=A0A1G2EGU2_9BACT|nr:MAG: hypothetical protein UV72_C0004G0031 [Candidatus Giovannonibacteria bacterium GW2011_GWB1_43_13]KKS99342.1 MAG: hypothetical protein UV75_C0006G0031 [Candidatus Giovannonibacteria bacterium GW2011_GWA1_43_15]KKT21714.1 MAG: hypothetical protein UW05_C0004G0008 [Candidatus Giovannonibacteria bacterium GW2011_GWC2_43_8]KKT63316.1 MAG: hypothetical protein UW55_C0005G0031 [Candidatus Giovannonibacteria bacterium GW2011_GWA2_44_26]OGF59242.1 MAG: hypothetical protein A2652_00880 [Candidatus